ncbi:MAG: 50S ribosomal protein L23 [Cytophagales bacterium]
MDILIKPILTEKVAALNEKGTFGFVVNLKANKIQIKEAVEKTYGVNVKEVRTMRYAGKRKSRYTKGGMVSGRTNAFKKAIIQLNDGEVLDIYSGI